MTRIALVEDNHRLAGFLRRALGATGIESDLFTHIETAWAAAQQPEYGLFVIDRGLPDGGGLSLVKRFRSGGLSHPCLILTARDALHDRIQGLEGGADDYLTKPFSMEELVARGRRHCGRRSTALVHAILARVCATNTGRRAGTCDMQRNCDYSSMAYVCGKHSAWGRVRGEIYGSLKPADRLPPGRMI